MTAIRGSLTSLERHMPALLAAVPIMNERIDRLEARVSALDTSVR
jgi:hypothetical protein